MTDDEIMQAWETAHWYRLSKAERARNGVDRLPLNERDRVLNFARAMLATQATDA